jgi:hypothetical protein
MIIFWMCAAAKPSMAAPTIQIRGFQIGQKSRHEAAYFPQQYCGS